eukprot:gnl/MRDRNA2_/MRDRNA2_65265_c0_seq2.p1 gnl/MRDRNA2_/MRDRNA2_65265_c0~~gnl/MRDRNA2_/MRDRNA2_65265_c0_seq2.p1  ORF type:complete len:616 (+),score=119.66 gnl/MRDRNA2_/MRDRNA2_65265_c0_seq2:103-1950(+)
MNLLSTGKLALWLLVPVAAESDSLTPPGVRKFVSHIRDLPKQSVALASVREANRKARKEIARDVRKDLIGKVRKKLTKQAESQVNLEVPGEEVAPVVETLKPWKKPLKVENMFRNSIWIMLASLLFLSLAAVVIMRQQKMAEMTKAAWAKISRDPVKPKAKPREDVLLGVTLAACSLCVAMWTPVFVGAYLAYQGWKVPMVMLAFPILTECVNQIVLRYRQWRNKLCAQDYFFNLKTVREDDVGKCLQLLGKTVSYYDSHEKAVAMMQHVKEVIRKKVETDPQGILNTYVTDDGFYFETDKEKVLRESFYEENISFEDSNNTAKAIEFFIQVEGNKMIAQTRARHDIIDGVLAFNLVGQFCKLDQPPPEMPLAMMIVLKLLDKCPMMYYIAPPTSYTYRDTSSVAAWPKKHSQLNVTVHRQPVKALCGPHGCSDAIYTYAAVCYAYIQTKKVDLDIGFIWFLQVTDNVRNNGTGVSLHIKKESTKEEIVEQLLWMKKDPRKHLQASASGFLGNRTHLFGTACPNMPFPKIDILFSSIPFTNLRNEDTDAWQEFNIDLKLRRPMIAYLLGVQDRFLCSFVHDPERVPTEEFSKNLQLELPVSFAPYPKDGYGAKEV